MTEPSESTSTRAKGSDAPRDGADARAGLSIDELRAAAWLKFLIVWLFLLVLVGGTVRITNSGLSIPHWPIIYYGPENTKPSLLPPFSTQAWQTAYDVYHTEVIAPGLGGSPRDMGTFKREFYTEYAHRFIAGTFAIVFLALIVQTMRKPVLRRRIGAMLVTSALLFIFQVSLGGYVVKTFTPTLGVSVHLCAAFIFVAMIAWMAMRLGQPENALESARPSRQLSVAWIAIALCFAQIFVGGLVANTQAGHSYTTWPLMGERLVPPANALWQAHYDPAWHNLVENTILIQWVHRWFAFVVAAAVIYLSARLMFLPLSPMGRWMARASVFVLVSQIMLGIVTLLEAVQPWFLGIAHLGLGLVLFLVLLAIVFELKHNSEVAAFESAPIREREEEQEKRFEARVAGLS